MDPVTQQRSAFHAVFRRSLETTSKVLNSTDVLNLFLPVILRILLSACEDDGRMATEQLAARRSLVLRRRRRPLPLLRLGKARLYI